MSIDIGELLDLCERYRDMGWAVQEQLAAVIEGEPIDEQNSNALEMIRKFLRKCDDAGVSDALEIADGIHDHLAKQAAE